MRPIDFERLVTEHVTDREELVRAAQECLGAIDYEARLKNAWLRYVPHPNPKLGGRKRRTTWEQYNV